LFVCPCENKREEGEEEGGREKRREGEGRLNAKIVC
jgi:hypothetical protein